MMKGYLAPGVRRGGGRRKAREAAAIKSWMSRGFSKLSAVMRVRHALGKAHNIGRWMDEQRKHEAMERRL